MATQWKIKLLMAGVLGLATAVHAQPPAPPMNALTGGPNIGPGSLPPGSPYIGCMPGPPGASVALCDPPQLRPNAFAGEPEPDWSTTCRFAAGVMYLQPHFNNNPAYGLFSAQTTEQSDFSYEHRGGLFFEVASIRDDGYGFRAHAWFFGDGGTSVIRNNALDPTVIISSPIVLPGFQVRSPSVASLQGNTGDLLTFTTHLRTSVVDLEVGRFVPGNILNYLVTVGGRYASLYQNYGAFRRSDVDFATLLYSHEFNGAGPTILVELSRSVADLGLNVYGNTRCAVLVGYEKQAAMLATNESSTNGLPVYKSLAFGHDEVIPNVEFEAGVIWQYMSGDIRPFVQGAFFSSTFFSGGTATSWDHQFTLLGVKIVAGLRF